MILVRIQYSPKKELLPCKTRISQPAVYPPEVERAANIALALEIIFGLFGILGVGHAFTGRTSLAIKLFAGWLVYGLVAIPMLMLTAGFALCLTAPISIAVPVITGIQARTYVKQTGSTGQWSSVAKFVGGALLIFVIAFIISMIIASSGGLNRFR